MYLWQWESERAGHENVRFTSDTSRKRAPGSIRLAAICICNYSILYCHLAVTESVTAAAGASSIPSCSEKRHSRRITPAYVSFAFTRFNYICCLFLNIANIRVMFVFTTSGVHHRFWDQYLWRHRHYGSWRKCECPASRFPWGRWISAGDIYNDSDRG